MAPFSEQLKPVISVIQVQKDETVFKKRYPKWLPFFRSPVSQDSLNTGTAFEPVQRKRSPNAILSPNHELLIDAESDEEEEEEKYEEGAPRLRRHHKTSNVQLFYDLFFVANLTTFTSKHEINSVDELKTYIAFFVILWATWFQVAKFDVRFASDSVFERVCKALQFGVMVGFAVVGPTFRTSWELDTPDAVAALQILQTLSLILMASRFISSAQYLSVYRFMRKNPKAHVPMLIHICTTFVCAFVFLGLYFAFNPSTPGNSGRAITGWFVTLALEAIILLVVSGQYRFMSFRHTPMVERLGLLTLIILGEGIIGLCEAVSKIGTSESYTSDVIGQLIAAVTVVYCMWMLYADQTEKKRVGRLRQEIWTVLHFPFHIAILLVCEGQATLTVWVKVWDMASPVLNLIYDPIFDPIYNAVNTTTLPPYPSASALAAYGNNLNQTVTGIYNLIYPDEQFTAYDPTYVSTYDAMIAKNGTWDDLYNGAYNITFQAFQDLCSFYEFDPEGADASGPPLDPTDAFNGIIEIFLTVFTYFFIAAGFTLILLTILLTLGRIEKFRSELINMAFRYIVGIGLACLAFMNLPSLVDGDNPAIFNYLITPWIVPTVCICYVTVVIVDNLVINGIRRRYIKWYDQNVGTESQPETRSGSA